MKKLLILSALALGLFSCSDEDRLVTDDVTGAKIVGFQESLVNVTHFEDVGPVTIQVPVTLFGLGNGQLPNEDIVVSYSVNTTASSATEGTEFSFPNSSGTVTIPAGSDFAMIPIVVNTGSLNPTEATSLVLDLTSSNEDVIVGQQYSQLVVNFVGCVSQIQEGSYTVTRGPGSTIGAGTTYQDVITMLGTNTFTSAHTPPYMGSYESLGLDEYGFTFEDVCGEITMGPQTLFDYYTNPVTGSGEVLTENSFQVNIAVGGGTTYFSNLTFTKN
ncbi:MAG TPA: hypothetical protein VF676_06140 [Flavobacterium sp.]|jgi:hypothetical protein